MNRLFLIFAMLLTTASFAVSKEKMTTVKGEVASIDTAANTLTVKEKDKNVVLNITGETKIMSGKMKKGLGEIKAGDRITAHTTEKEGKTVAKSVWISAEAAARPKMNMEKMEKK